MKRNIDSVSRKTILQLTSELIELAKRPLTSYLGRSVQITVNSSPASISAGWSARHDPDTYYEVMRELDDKVDGSYPIPDETRDAYDYIPE